jgi:4-amino-4-deoxy-L-arabinose transferase-like glycosyltransferase
MFNSEMGGQIAWLIPAALLLMVAGLVLAARAPRTDRSRAAFVLWGGWLVVTGLVFSFMQGIFHAYYTIALAPAIGALVGMGAVVLWRARSTGWAPGVLAASVAITAVWSYILLGRSASFYPWLRGMVLVVGLIAAAAIVAVSQFSARRVSLAVAVAAIVASLAGPAAYSWETASTAHTGSIVSAGPNVAGAGFGGGRGGFRAFPGGAGNGAAGNGGAFPGGAGNGGAFPGGAGNGGMGGLLNSTTPSAELVALLKSNASAYTWVAAAVGSNNASGYQLATEEPVMAIGGFNGSDPSPTLAEFQAHVAAGEIHYFIGGGGFRSNGGSGASSQIASWVAANYTATTVGGVTVYDLSAG